MTPLARYFARFLPNWLVAPALALAYAAMLFSLVVRGEEAPVDNVYADVGGNW